MAVTQLTKEQTFALIPLVQQGNKDALQQVVFLNEKLVYSIVKRYVNMSKHIASDEDLYQLGVIGLIKAINRFDMTFDVEFSTYAVPMIIGEIVRYFRDNNYVKVNRPTKTLSLKILRAQDDFYAQNYRKMTYKELCEMFNEDIDTIKNAIQFNTPLVYLDEEVSISTKSGVEKDITFRDTIEDKIAKKDFEYVELMDMINKLPERMRQIIHMRFFLDMTQTEVAEEFGISQVQICRIEKSAIRMLQGKEPINTKQIKQENKQKSEIRNKKKYQIFQDIKKGLSKNEIMLKYMITDGSYRNYVYQYSKNNGVTTPKRGVLK